MDTWVFWAALLALGVLAASFIPKSWTIFEWEVGLLYVNGRFAQVLGPGRHRALRPFANLDLHRVRTADRVLPTGVADATSADKLPFRIAGHLTMRVRDAREFFERQGESIIQQAALTALAQLAASQRLDELIQQRGALGSRLVELLAPEVPYVEFVRADVHTLQLPPEIRRLLSEVEKARLEGQAALERARGEQATLRSLSNAARLMRDNPALAQLRLLQTVSGSRGPTTLVLGTNPLPPGAESPRSERDSGSLASDGIDP
jgi:regulator of protease activity HflC (stomatin/prohibitin superfamily)